MDAQLVETTIKAYLTEIRSRLDKAAGNRKAKTRSRADVVALLRAIEFIEHAVELAQWNAVTFIDDLQ